MKEINGTRFKDNGLVFTLAFLSLPEALPRSKNDKGSKYYKKKKKCLYLAINYPFLEKAI